MTHWRRGRGRGMQGRGRRKRRRGRKRRRRRDSQQTSQVKDRADQEGRVTRHAYGLRARAAGKEGLAQAQESLICSSRQAFLRPAGRKEAGGQRLERCCC